MSVLTADRFTEFYKAANGKTDDPDFGPFPWQERLAQRVSAGEWPQVIALPTAAGKTTCIDIAVYALACGADSAPRRIFFVVDRRIVVDQAYLHARRLSIALAEATSGILHEVATSLRKLAQDKRPLDVYALRGGMYRESAWVRSPLQPTVIASTVDQVGSRLLFRGYGVSDSMRPIHAGLVSNDALILLDEAHCSRPFDQTARAIEGVYQHWGESEGRRPLRFVTMTATPSEDIPVTRIEKAEQPDYDHPVLGRRIKVSKPTTLVVAEKATGKKAIPELVKELAKQARTLAEQGFKAVGIIVNRVLTARLLWQDLGKEAVLLTGRMRPLDRDKLYVDRLLPLLSNAQGTPPQFVIGTQCLEVGADFDFHALVTECASLDALRQRFGRLNRVALRSEAKGVVVVRGDQSEDSSDDPVYQDRLSNTWKWLTEKKGEGTFDFGVAAVAVATDSADLGLLNSKTVDAPVLFPAHLDCWVQTNPSPKPDPEPAFFLHGPKSGIPDVQVVFRGDLGNDTDRWAEIVALCPPSSSETLPVRIDVFRRWLADQDPRDESSDLEGEATSDDEQEINQPRRSALRWKGPSDRRTGIVAEAGEVRPGDTFVVSTTVEVVALGDFPGGVATDLGDRAFLRSRDKAIIRLTDLELEDDDDELDQRLTEAIEAKRSEVDDPDFRKAMDSLTDTRTRAKQRHPLGGWVVFGRRRLRQFDPSYLEDTESAAAPDLSPVTLRDHSQGVTTYARQFAAGCGLPVEVYTQAGLFHDLGKLDPRFQAMLQGRSPRTIAGAPLGKSGNSGATRRERDEARQVHRYPSGGRHELLSAALVATKSTDDLLLHLIATHHGSGRPFASPVEENDFVVRPFRTELFEHSYEVDSCSQDVASWNKELPERFWRVVRKYGWWGAAYREAAFRLADQAESRDEQDQDWEPTPGKIPVPGFVNIIHKPGLHPIDLTGLDGSNPLAVLAALGTLRLVDRVTGGEAKLSWKRAGRWIPILHLPGDLDLISLAFEHLHREANPQAGKEAERLDKEYRRLRKLGDEAEKDLKARKLRGKERDEARTTEVLPKRIEADRARAEWLTALERAVPAPFLSLGKALSVTESEFRTFAERMASRLAAEGKSARFEADFAAAFGSEACILNNGKISPTEFQLITGSGHQFFLETLSTLMEEVTADQLRRALFGPWTYSDPRLSFRWDPIDDRRYAYAWNDPSSGQVQTEHGANILAAFALPLFPVVPTLRGAATTGFDSQLDPSEWRWPLWRHPYSLDVVRSLLAAESIQQAIKRTQVATQGVSEVYRVRRIEVGRPPLSKLNLTSAVTV